jgi:DedD protein
MAFFKSRSSGNASADDKNADGMAAQSIDTLRRQARQRLIGATVLVLVAVIGFPLVFDTKPREVAADIRIDMPDKDAVRASQPPAPLPASTTSTPAPVPVPDAEVVEKPVVPPSVMPEKPAVVQPKEEELPAKTDANTKPEEAAPRFIVQVGAFADEGKAKEVRAKLEKAGIKTYTHVAQTKEGKRIRVRVGPFTSKDDAQKTVDKIKSLQLSASVLTI